MTFRTNYSYALNTAYYNFGELSYNAEKYYFYNESYTASKSTNRSYLTSITGYFPAGRIVEVDRNFDMTEEDTSKNIIAGGGKDYAFQSWSLNKKSSATNALEHSFYTPSSGSEQDLYEKIFEYFKNYKLIENYETNYTSIFGSVISDKNSQFAVKSYKKDSDYFAVRLKEDGDEIIEEIVTQEKITLENAYRLLGLGNENNNAYEILTNTSGANPERSGTLVVTSLNYYNAGIFYANYVKTNNYTLSGIMLNADNILAN